jgi:hypothetical protein
MSWESYLRWSSFPICIFIFGLSLLPTHANTFQKPQQRVPYTVILNHVTRNEDRSYEERNISILMYPDDFTEPKLRQLMTYFLKKYPRPNLISVYLYSHTDQVDYFSRRLPDMKDPKRDESYRKYPHGVFLRFRGNEVMRYTIPASNERKTIVVKGRDVGEQDTR